MATPLELLKRTRELVSTVEGSTLCALIHAMITTEDHGETSPEALIVMATAASESIDAGTLNQDVPKAWTALFDEAIASVEATETEVNALIKDLGALNRN